MRDFAPNPDGTYPFQPDTIETRKYFARAVVMALAPDETVDPSITFPDLDPSDAFYPAANIAVKLHWMKTDRARARSRRTSAVTMTMVHRVLTLALGLGPAVKSLNHLHTADGVDVHASGELRRADPGDATGAPLQQLQRSERRRSHARRCRARRSRTRCIAR